MTDIHQNNHHNSHNNSNQEQYESMRRSVFANCRSVSEFEKIATVGEGTYGKYHFT